MLDTTHSQQHAHQRLEELASGWRGWLSVGYDPEAADELARVEAALAWANEGIFGHCARCASALPAEQVENDPADITCGECHEHCELVERSEWALAFTRVA